MRIDEIIKLVDAGYSKSEIADLMRDNRNNDPEPAADPEHAADPEPAADPESGNAPVMLQSILDSINDAIAKIDQKINDINLFNADFENKSKSDEDILAEIIAPKLIERK